MLFPAWSPKLSTNSLQLTTPNPRHSRTHQTRQKANHNSWGSNETTKTNTVVQIKLSYDELRNRQRHTIEPHLHAQKHTQVSQYSGFTEGP